MKKRRWLSLLKHSSAVLPIRLALVALLLMPPAWADEVWRSSQGTIVYEIDRGSEAVLSFPLAGSAGRGEIVLLEMAGRYTNRGAFFGYWSAATGDQACGNSVTDRRGNKHRYWGRATVIFAKPGFPSAITLLRGNCLDEQQFWLEAQPVVGG